LLIAAAGRGWAGLDCAGLDWAGLASAGLAGADPNWGRWLAETELADTGLADTGLADSELADSELADTELADTELADIELADIGAITSKSAWLLPAPGAAARALARSDAWLLTGLASAFLRCGPITMIMFRPSCLGCDSTKPSSSTSPASRWSSL
jgi:hypothetical protein